MDNAMLKQYADRVSFGDPDHTKLNRDLGDIDWSGQGREKGPNR